MALIHRLHAGAIIDVRNRRHRAARDLDAPKQIQVVAHGGLLIVGKRRTMLVEHRRYQKHVGRILVAPQAKPFVDVLAQYAGRKWPEAFAELDLEVHYLLHLPRTRIANYRARAQSSRAKLHPPLKPPDHLFGSEALRYAVGKLIV